MPPVTMLIKPASSNCNLECRYCFYHSIAEKRSTKSFGMMSVEILEFLTAKALSKAEGSCTFIFQGGEPTLRGLDFFEKLVEFQKKYNTRKVNIINAIQTNGVLLDSNWCSFLARNGFLTGLSLDGPKDIHDLYRVDYKGNGTFKFVMEASALLEKYRAEYNILFVVNNTTARHADKIYNFFKKNNFRYLQYIPCLDPLHEQPGSHEYSLEPGRFAQFLKKLFDLWYLDLVKGEGISIRDFDNYVGMAMGYPPESCGMSGRCTGYYVIESDGGVYPCDFYVTDEWYLGNIMEEDFESFLNKPAAKTFMESSLHVDEKCRECEWYALCRGGCRRNREPFVNGKPALNYFCQSYKEFFEYAADRIYGIASMMKNRIGATYRHV